MRVADRLAVSCCLHHVFAAKQSVPSFADYLAPPDRAHRLQRHFTQLSNRENSIKGESPPHAGTDAREILNLKRIKIVRQIFISEDDQTVRLSHVRRHLGQHPIWANSN